MNKVAKRRAGGAKSPGPLYYVHRNTEPCRKLSAPKELEREQMREQLTTIAILGANAVVENALALLLEGEGYSTRVLKTFPLGEALEEDEEMPLGGVDLVVLAPSLSTSECEAFLAARPTSSQRISTTTTTTTTSPIPVIVLCSPMKEAPPLLEEEEGVRSVPWPTTRERLVREIEDVLHQVYLPPGYYLDRSDPEVLILRSPEGEFVARFSAPGHVTESVEREAWEDHRQRNMRPPPK